jgi:proteasome lid subunit RPN8/RPN11
MERNLNQSPSPGSSTARLAIECSPGVLEQILAEADRGFYSVPLGGAEEGGVLYGSYDGSRILIQATRPLPCEHASGPSFNLSDADYSRLAALLEAPERESDLAGMEVVGWYHSQTRSKISFTDADLAIHDRFFPKPWQVALVLRPYDMRPTELGLYVRRADGAMRRWERAAEAALMSARAARNERAQPAAGAAAVTPKPGVAKAPAHVAAVAAKPVRRKLWGWAVAAAVFLLAAATAGYFSGVFSTPQRPAPKAVGLHLHAIDRNGLLEIRWDGNLPALRQARSGTLEISEGPHVHILPMNPEFMRGGSLSYVRHSEVVRIRISLILRDGSELQQEWAFVGDPGSGRAARAQAAAPQVPAAEVAPEAARSPVVDSQALRKLGQPAGSEQARQSPGASAPASRAAVGQPAITRPSPLGAQPPRSLPERAGNRAPAQTAASRPTPEPRSGTAAARHEPPSAAAAAAAHSPASANRPVAQVVQPPLPTLPTPAPSGPEPPAGKVPVPASPEPVTRPPESSSAPPSNAVAPSARALPATQPEVAPPALSGQWTFGRTSPSGSPFPPESVALSLSEEGGVLKGTLAGRYRTPKSSGMKPEVRFSFQGAERPGNMRFPWATSDGRSGSVELIRLPNKSDSLEVVWYSQDRKLIFDDVLVRVAK